MNTHTTLLTLTVAVALGGSPAPAAAQPHAGEQGNLRYRDYELLVNPATLGAAAGHRVTLGVARQWAGFASPVAELMQYQLPVTPAAGVGAWLYHDVFGAQRNTQVGAAYAHALRFGSRGTLAFGLSLALLVRSERRVQGYDPADDLLRAPEPGYTAYNAGFGAAFFTDTYYVGLSIPQWLANTPENDLRPEALQLYLTAGYRFRVSEAVTLTPAALVMRAQHTAFGYEATLTAAYAGRFELGAGWASHARLQFDVGVAATKWLALRYQYAQHLGADYHQATDHLIVARIHWPRLFKAPETL
jgi:type IX secretion system PorP/SprF family membrane protein